jgi:UDP-MurNAc hydroxylase
MRIRFVSHASYLLEAANRTILCDPWTAGKAFNNGWALTSPPDPVDYARVDYLWISHEHPDHLNFPTLKAIPEAHRRRVVVLYHKHASPRVAESLRGLGFTVRELPVYRWLRLDPGVEVYCGAVNIRDSFLAVRAEGHSVLNLNDCVLNEAQLRYVKARVGPVSVLLTQFSFANWVGNAADEVGGAAGKLDELRAHVRIMDPAVTIPFASFVFFCNAENARMNAWANTPETVEALGLEGVVFLYPGDEWRPGGTNDSASAVRRYMRDFAAKSIDPTPPSVALEVVRQAAQASVDNFRQRLPWVLLKTVEEFQIFVTDLAAILQVDARRGTVEVLTPETADPARARFTMCSQVAWYSFHFPWGTNTTEISGMYLDREYTSRGRNRYFRYQSLLATEILDLRAPRRWPRVAEFFWAKKWELFHAALAGRL